MSVSVKRAIRQSNIKACTNLQQGEEGASRQVHFCATVQTNKHISLHARTHRDTHPDRKD
jgi:hypothetical protein